MLRMEFLFVTRLGRFVTMVHNKKGIKEIITIEIIVHSDIGGSHYNDISKLERLQLIQ